MKVLSVPTGEILHTINVPTRYGCKDLDYDSECQRLFVPDGEGKIHIYSLFKVRFPELKVFQSPPELLHSAVTNNKQCIRGFSRDHANSYFFTGDTDGQIGVFELGKPSKERFSKQIA